MTGKTILIVEDEQSLMKILAQELATAGFRVLQAQNGREGLTLAQQEYPDLLLVDILMPEMDGITMLQEIRKDPKGSEIPVIILTNVTDAETTAKALENKAYEYLIKSSWEPKKIVELIQDKFRQKSV